MKHISPRTRPLPARQPRSRPAHAFSGTVLFIPAFGAQPHQLEVMTLQGKPVLSGHRLLQHIDGRVAELNPPAALHADEMIMVRAAPDMLVPGAPGRGVLMHAHPADYSRLNEQRKVPVDRDQGEVVLLILEQPQHVICLEMPLYIANCFQ